jgi:hypothetical protein
MQMRLLHPTILKKMITSWEVFGSTICNTFLLDRNSIRLKHVCLNPLCNRVLGNQIPIYSTTKHPSPIEITSITPQSSPRVGEGARQSEQAAAIPRCPSERASPPHCRYALMNPCSFPSSTSIFSLPPSLDLFLSLSLV